MARRDWRIIRPRFLKSTQFQTITGMRRAMKQKSAQTVSVQDGKTLPLHDSQRQREETVSEKGCSGDRRKRHSHRQEVHRSESRLQKAGLQFVDCCRICGRIDWQNLPQPIDGSKVPARKKRQSREALPDYGILMTKSEWMDSPTGKHPVRSDPYFATSPGSLQIMAMFSSQSQVSATSE